MLVAFDGKAKQIMSEFVYKKGVHDWPLKKYKTEGVPGKIGAHTCHNKKRSRTRKSFTDERIAEAQRG